MSTSFDCPVCNGSGCAQCDNGRFEIRECGLTYVNDPNIWRLIKYARLAEKGMMPVAGGLYDQMKSFVDGIDFVYREQAYWKKKLGIMS